MTKPKLVLYVDVVSPFAYLAFHIVNVCRFLSFQLMTAGSSQGAVPPFVGYLDALFNLTVYGSLLLLFGFR